MRLLIFGGTGPTGALLVEQALDAGHHVTAVARDPARLPGAGHDRLTAVRGDVLRPGAWQDAVLGQDAVASCLGTRDRRHPTTVYSRGTATVVSAMLAAGVRRLVCLSSAGLEIPPGTPLAQRLVTRHVVQRLYRHAYADMAVMERLVAGSGLDWTVVRPPMLTDGPLTGRYRTAVGGHLDGMSRISRADLAHYLLHHLGDRDAWGRVVEIAT
ncbi:NAD(P)-dependent oxidoreductase [Nonomuraea rhodomycinica]|uniref:SDR family oxidoreductase n=1 Tax=Nonomuraea rhodomycinica TaxID=1712872 RepID=A0A7Y6IJY3_9ACTN|nr:SDR family oxidoreductase [Nonomuraea rhodomycinica]NUW39100.1 SDR family oxidoreductase [Nonomuraea rhodomycinica]